MSETCGTHERGEFWPPNLKEVTSLDDKFGYSCAWNNGACLRTRNDCMKYTSMSWADFSAVRYRGGRGGVRLLRAQLVRLESWLKEKRRRCQRTVVELIVTRRREWRRIQMCCVSWQCVCCAARCHVICLSPLLFCLCVFCLLSFFPFVDHSFSLYRRSRANAVDLLVTSLLRGATLQMVQHGSSLWSSRSTSVVVVVW